MERARPRRGRGAAEREGRLCRKPGARHSWDDELRCTMKNTGAYGAVADSGAVPWRCRRLPSPSELGETWFGSRSERRPAPSQAACQVRGDRRSRRRDAPAAAVRGYRPKGGFCRIGFEESLARHYRPCLALLRDCVWRRTIVGVGPAPRMWRRTARIVLPPARPSMTTARLNAASALSRSRLRMMR